MLSSSNIRRQTRVPRLEIRFTSWYWAIRNECVKIISLLFLVKNYFATLPYAFPTLSQEISNCCCEKKNKKKRTNRYRMHLMTESEATANFVFYPRRRISSDKHFVENSSSRRYQQSSQIFTLPFARQFNSFEENRVLFHLYFVSTKRNNAFSIEKVPLSDHLRCSIRKIFAFRCINFYFVRRKFKVHLFFKNRHKRALYEIKILGGEGWVSRGPVI